MKRRKTVGFALKMGFLIVCLTGCGNEKAAYEELLQKNTQLQQENAKLIEENDQLKKRQEDSEKLVEEDEASDLSAQKMIKASITGGFTATVRDILPDYCFDGETPAVAVVTLFQDGPFVLNVGQEFAKQLEVGKSYYFEVVPTEVGEIAEKEFNDGYADPTIVLRRYHIRLESYREPAEDELGLQSVKLCFQRIE